SQALVARITQCLQSKNVSLHWVPGHSKVAGNEAARELAKKATETESATALQSVARPLSVVHREARKLRFQPKTNAFISSKSDSNAVWSQIEPLNKLHKLAVWIRRPGGSHFEDFQALSGGRVVSQDNSTRWNSWFLMMDSALKCKQAVNQYIDNHTNEIQHLKLSRTDWELVRHTRDFLIPFYEVTKATEGDEVTFDDLLFSMDSLVTHYKAAFERYALSRELTEAVTTSWFLLDKYYKGSDECAAYAAAILLHPTLRLQYVKENWKKPWIQPAIKRVTSLFETYQPSKAVAVIQPLDALQSRQLSHLKQYRLKVHAKLAAKPQEDELKRFINAPPFDIMTTPLQWWLEPAQQAAYPRLSRLAIDVLSIATMSAEAERIFSGARRTISWERARLKGKSIEHTKCLKHWQMNGYNLLGIDDEAV
ncbi:hypothetical protein B0A49_13530, partial [Cryomyces minteri]